MIILLIPDFFLKLRFQTLTHLWICLWRNYPFLNNVISFLFLFLRPTQLGDVKATKKQHVPGSNPGPASQRRSIWALGIATGSSNNLIWWWLSQQQLAWYGEEQIVLLFYYPTQPCSKIYIQIASWHLYINLYLSFKHSSSSF